MAIIRNVSIAQYSLAGSSVEEEGEELGEEGEVAVPLSLLVAVPLPLLYWTCLLTLISCKYHLYSRFSFFLYCIQQCVSVTVSVRL